MPHVSAEKIAKALNVSSRWVRDMAERGIIPRESHGRYDLVKCVLAVARLKIDHRLDFFAIAKRTIAKQWPEQFKKAYRR